MKTATTKLSNGRDWVEFSFGVTSWTMRNSEGELLRGLSRADVDTRIDNLIRAGWE